MIKVTDSKTIVGRILKVGRSQQYCTHWGEMLFKGREVLVVVQHKHKRQKVPMYIRDDSDIGILCLTSNTLSGKEWNITIHGEFNTTIQGCLFIDRIGLSARVAKQVNINKYFKLFMQTKILKVVAQTGAVYVPSKKAENGQVAKSVIRLKELGGEFEDEYVCTLFGNLALCKFVAGDLVAAALRFQTHEVNGQFYQDVVAAEIQVI